MKSLNGLLSGCPIPAFRAFRWEIDHCDRQVFIVEIFSRNMALRLEVVAAIRAMEHGHILGIFLLEQSLELTPNVSDSVFHSCS